MSDDEHAQSEVNTSTDSKANAPPTPTEPVPVINAEGKVIVMFKHTGNAPPMKQKVFGVNAASPWRVVQAFLRKLLKYKESDPLFLFVNSTFQPSPDEIVADLAKCFHNNGKLIVNYCTTAAWG
eukprot:Phypoly_transcript_24839.p1 GENE.Phypoly_transcript_24839~~Phypoly_transcript_24839.p1  ORF type:complete len:124 (+),score=18.55 Phypoly_transcript_24839:116-487(+)